MYIDNRMYRNVVAAFPRYQFGIVVIPLVLSLRLLYERLSLHILTIVYRRVNSVIVTV